MTEAMPVMLAMASYLGTILEALDDARMQKLLAAEHGGFNDSYAETYALTGNPRWRRLAERIYHRQVLDPLAEQGRLARPSRQHPDPQADRPGAHSTS